MIKEDSFQTWYRIHYSSQCLSDFPSGHCLRTIRLGCWMQRESRDLVMARNNDDGYSVDNVPRIDWYTDVQKR